MTVSQRDRDIFKMVAETPEPGFVFRAQDRFLPDVLETYLDSLKSEGASDEFVQVVQDKLDAVRSWQERNEDRVKVPDLKAGQFTAPGS